MVLIVRVRQMTERTRSKNLLGSTKRSRDKTKRNESSFLEVSYNVGLSRILSKPDRDTDKITPFYAKSILRSGSASAIPIWHVTAASSSRAMATVHKAEAPDERVHAMCWTGAVTDRLPERCQCRAEEHCFNFMATQSCARLLSSVGAHKEASAADDRSPQQ
jgi:hypothetical protein